VGGGAYVTLCSVLDCGIPASTRGLCKKHYMRFRRHGVNAGENVHRRAGVKMHH